MSSDPQNGTSATPLLLLTPEQTATALAIGKRRLWSLTQTGEIKSLRIGRSVRYEPSALRDYVESLKEKGGSGA